ncbi:MAG: hypothetical protein ACRDVL_00900, partial [Acidimicrobiia bacterium]
LVRSDLLQALREDGIDEPTLVVASADPPAGPPQGIDELLAVLSERARDRAAVYRKIGADLSEMVDSLLAATGGGGLDFEARGAAAVEEALDALSRGEEATAVLGLTRFLDDMAAESGEALQTQIEAMAVRLPIEVRRASEGGGQSLADTIIAPLRSLLTRRARANAELANLALGLQSVDAGAGR